MNTRIIFWSVVLQPEQVGQKMVTKGRFGEKEHAHEVCGYLNANKHPDAQEYEVVKNTLELSGSATTFIQEMEEGEVQYALAKLTDREKKLLELYGLDSFDSGDDQ